MTLIIVPYLRISSVAFSVIQILYVVSTNIAKFEILNRFDEHFHLSEKMIAKMREIKNIPETEKYWKGNI